MKSCTNIRPVETIREYGGSRRCLVSIDEDADGRTLNVLTVRIYNHIFGIGGKGFCRESATGESRCFGVRVIGERNVAVLMYETRRWGLKNAIQNNMR